MPPRISKTLSAQLFCFDPEAMVPPIISVVFRVKAPQTAKPR
ncbi:hypothetical protein [Bradyrhizobium sp. STM 3561]